MKQMTRPCPNCPWRVDSSTDEIPGLDIMDDEGDDTLAFVISLEAWESTDWVLDTRLEDA